MLMVQSCVTRPPSATGGVSTAEEGEEGGGLKVDKRRRKQLQQQRQQEAQQSGLFPARNAATYFVSRFLSRYAIVGRAGDGCDRGSGRSGGYGGW